MTKRRILVLYSKSLLAQGVENLLRRDDGLEVIGIDMESKEAARYINSLQPQVVIVDGDDHPETGASLILQVMRENPSTRVICISLNGSNVDIFRKSQVIVTQAEELVAAIKME